MEYINVSSAKGCYKAYIGNSFDGFAACLDECGIYGKLLLVCDEKVNTLYGNEFLSRIKNRDIYMCNITSSEENKSLDTVKDIYSRCLQNNFDRSSAIIALGGGVVGDTAGFAASSFMRGIKLIQVPTTVIADVDSSIGGKVGVNHSGIKNLIGSFYNPDFVYINTAVLKSLPQEHVISGIAEIIKYAVLFDKGFFYYLTENVQKLLNLDKDVLTDSIRECIFFKSEIVSKDIFDKNQRQLLNFGHTLGHAIESMSHFTIHHGMAVAAGMMFECILSNSMGILMDQEMAMIFSLIRECGLSKSFHLPDIDYIFKIMKHDKKSEDGNIKFILPRAIGDAFVTTISGFEPLSNAFMLLKGHMEHERVSQGLETNE
jgi:3-dehydroquinate synthase